MGFSTAYAEYYLLQPSDDYQTIMEAVNQKITLTKLIIEFLLDESWQNPSYEDLLRKLQSSGNSDLTEEVLLRHAQFLCDRVG